MAKPSLDRRQESGMLTAVVAALLSLAQGESFDDFSCAQYARRAQDRGSAVRLAVVADSFWQAKTARDAVRIDWDEGRVCMPSSTSAMMQQFREQAKSPARVVRRDGDPDAALAKAAHQIEAVSSSLLVTSDE